MPVSFEKTCQLLRDNPKTWVVSGVAGFIGSNLLETLLGLNQHVVGLDNFITGHQRNLDEVKDQVTRDQWNRFRFIEGDIRDIETCRAAVSQSAFVLHHAALGSVPRSINDPIMTNSVNTNGFLNMLVAARDERVHRFVFAASSSTYGDHKDLPKTEDRIGKPLSPYAVTKYVNELYADVFAKTYGLSSIGLRYFNIFGRRQDPDGAYAAVIPKWIIAMLQGKQVEIYGDGETSRDFCHIENAVQANLLAATAGPEAENQVYNIAFGGQATLNELFDWLKQTLGEHAINIDQEAIYHDFRAGDVRHSRADISKAQMLLGYQPRYNAIDGIRQAMDWYIQFANSNSSQQNSSGKPQRIKA